MLRSLFLKDYPYRDNYGNLDGTDTVTVHVANSSWEHDVLHIGIENQHESVTMNFTLEEVKELAAIISRFIESAQQDRTAIIQ
jgi:putative aminopeptidase FrvX